MKCPCCKYEYADSQMSSRENEPFPKIHALIKSFSTVNPGEELEPFGIPINICPKCGALFKEMRNAPI